MSPLVGGQGAQNGAAAREIVIWLKRIKARRIASVCSGAFLLAEAGLLEGRRATTHWGSTELFARAFAPETGTTTAKAVQRLRLESARTAVETGHALLSTSPRMLDSATPAMRRAFLRTFGQPPQALRRRK